MDEVNPYAAPLTDSPPNAANEEDGRSGDVWRDGKLLVMRHGAVLPDRCVKCNAPAAGERLKKTLIWRTLWSWRMRTTEIEFGVCRRHRVREKVAKTVATSLLYVIWMWFAAVLIVRLCAGVGAQAEFILGAWMIAAIATAAIAFFAASMAFVHKIDDNYVWLRRVDRDYLAELPPFDEPRDLD